MNIVKTLMMVLIMGLLSACESEQDVYNKQFVANSSLELDYALVNLEGKIKNKRLKNILILELYAKKLANIDPDLSEIANSIGQAGSADGEKLKSLGTRVKDFNKNSILKDDLSTLEKKMPSITKEYNSLKLGLDADIFDESLMDEINTLADLSGGELKRISIPKSATNQAAATPGQYLVGNPQYGSWQKDSSGSSVWMWIAAYSMLNNRPYYANSWYSKPRYSYYNDYGRSSYGTYRSRDSMRKLGSKNSFSTAKSKPKKSYISSKTKAKKSNFLKSSSRNSGFSSTSKSTSKPKSSSFFGSSQRNSGFRTSNGFGSWGGK